MSYRMRGTYYENCNCDPLCPCTASNLMLPADQDRCHLLLGYRIESGDVDGVDVSGTAAALFVDTPQQMSDGGWRVGLFLDANATEEQREKLQAVFSGEQGGPAASFAPLIGEVLGVETLPIACSDDGRSHSMRIGDAVDLEFEDFAGYGESSTVWVDGITHPANARLTIGRASRARFDAFGISESHDGKNTHFTTFQWNA